MLRIVTTSLLVALAVPATAAPLQPVTMTRDGDHYRYTSQLKGDMVAIHGEQLDTGQAIDLVIDRGGRVEGTVGGSPVSFSVPKEKRDSIVAELASANVSEAATATQVAAIR